MASVERRNRITWHNFLYACSGALLIVGGFLAWAVNEELNLLSSESIEKAVIVDGVLIIPRHSGQSTPIGILDKNGFEYRCYIGECGYHGVREDLGKHAKTWLVSGQIVQIKVDGVTRISMQQRVSRLKGQRSRNLGVIVFGVLLGTAGFLIQGRVGARKNNSGDI